jgi:O-antigen ligase
MRPTSAVSFPLPPEVEQGDERVSGSDIGLGPDDKQLLVVWLSCGVLAAALPYPATKIFLALVLGVWYLRASLNHFHLALSGFILLLPFHDAAYKGSILLPGLNIQTLFVIFLCLAAAVTPSVESSRIERNPLAIPVLLLVALMTVSSISVAASSESSLFELLTSIKNAFAYALVALIVFWKVNKPEHKLMVLVCVFATVMINVLFSLREVSQTLASGRIFMRHRAVSLISDQPNLYAGFLAMYIFFFIAMLMYYPTSRRYRLALFAATAIVAVNLVYTMSRGGWLACGLAALFVTGTRARRLGLPIALLAMLLYVWLPDMAVERGRTTFQGEYDPRLLVSSEGLVNDEAATRIVQWRSFLPMMAEHPIFGVGYGGFPEFFKSGGYFPEPKGAHSSVIELGVELGPIGLALYAWILVATYRGSSRVFRNAGHPIERALALGMVAATVCLFLLDLTGTRFRSGNIMAFFWILAAIVLNSRLPESNDDVTSLDVGTRPDAPRASHALSF